MFEGGEKVGFSGDIMLVYLYIAWASILLGFTYGESGERGVGVQGTCSTTEGTLSLFKEPEYVHRGHIVQ